MENLGFVCANIFASLSAALLICPARCASLAFFIWGLQNHMEREAAMAMLARV
jgi:hypothetical protein